VSFKLKWGLGIFLGVSLLTRIVTNDNITTTKEIPPGYSAPKSIALLQAQEQQAFEKAMEEIAPQDKAALAPVAPVNRIAFPPVRSQRALAYKKPASRLKLVSNISPKKVRAKVGTRTTSGLVYAHSTEVSRPKKLSKLRL
jgi:hypothetical protein